MSLGLRWALIVLVIAYGLSAIAAVEDLDQMIREAEHDQHQLALEIQNQLDIQNDKNPEGAVSKETMAMQGFKIKIIKNKSRSL